MSVMREAGRRTAEEDRAQEAQDAPPASPAATRPRPAQRGTFSTRLRPELHHHLKQQVLALGWSLGKPVSMEDVLEAIMTEYRDDPALQERVRQRIDEG